MKIIIFLIFYLATNLVNFVLSDNFPVKLPIPFASGFSNDDRFSDLTPGSRRYYSPSSRTRYYQSPSGNGLSAAGLAPDSVCSSDSVCAGYPLAFCDGTCKCREGALNAGSTCIPGTSSSSRSGSCPTGQVYVSEVGACMSGKSILKYKFTLTKC